jgi:endonuclease YncB( thermonuclease family)
MGAVTGGFERAFVIGAALVLASCGDGGALDRLAFGGRARVADVRSGDLIVLDNGQTVRLIGLDSPWRGEPGADAARADLQRLVGGRAVELFYGGARKDEYGRVLAQLRRADDRRWVQCALLRDGVARVRTDADNRALAGAMLACEAEARRGKRGVWAGAVSPVRLPGEVDDRTNGFQIVEGRVARVTPTSGGVYLDFADARGGFAAEIDRRAVGRLREAGLAPADLAGRLIRVRGVVGYGGVMRIDHPEQIERLDAR